MPHATQPQVITERFVLPEDQPQRLSARVDAAVAALYEGRTSDASALVDALAEDEDRSFYQARSSAEDDYLTAGAQKAYRRGLRVPGCSVVDCLLLLASNICDYFRGPACDNLAVTSPCFVNALHFQ